MRAREPTPRQREILGWIEAFARQHGMPPTVREIGRAFGIASSSVFKHLVALERKGLLRRGELGARSLELTGPARSGRGECDACTNVPLVGRIAAGVPIFAEENIEGEITVSRRLVRSGRYFALKVKGDSMIDAGILDGDTVIVRVQPTVHRGEIAVCLIGNEEATLKRVYWEARGRVRLQPENPAMQPIVVHVGKLRIQGRVVAVERRL